MLKKEISRLNSQAERDGFEFAEARQRFAEDFKRQADELEKSAFNERMQREQLRDITSQARAYRQLIKELCLSK